MHQPDYRDPLTNRYTLPWVRLHAVKDYLHMAQVLADFPQVHATFNFVPSLVEQLIEYAQGHARDQWLELSLQETWTDDNKQFLLANFFSINVDRFIHRYPRYDELLQQRTAGPDRLPEDYFRDLAAWFNLAWIDPGLIARDAILSTLAAKARVFTTDDIRTIAEKQHEIIAQVLPFYCTLADRGQIELTTSPYYHPILPLLVDDSLAREASPNLPLPGALFAHPEDAIEQLRQAVEFHAQVFGREPRGLWPSEGAVSQAILSYLPQNFRWLASDEGILARSLGVAIQRDGDGHVTNPDVLYQPFDLTQGRPAECQLAIIFRDHLLSDRIGFTYQHMESRAAAEDLVARLHRIHESLRRDEPHLVTIILDGENCWEHYQDNGEPFLRRLYELLSSDADLTTVTVSEYLDRFPPRQHIERLATGSWINANLETWIGGEAQNRAWEVLARTRDTLIGWQREDAVDDLSVLAQAWRELYIAEGSDWFWWYCSWNSSPQNYLFDEAFRAHLRNAYLTIGLPAPDWLAQPIYREAPVTWRMATAYISPPLTASRTLPPEWAAAGFVQAQSNSGTMRRAESRLHRLWYGYDATTLYLRLEAHGDLSSSFIGFYFAVPRARRTNRRTRLLGDGPGTEGPGLAWEIALWPDKGEATLSRADGQEVWLPMAVKPRFALSDGIVEVAIPLRELGLNWGDALGLCVVLAEGTALRESIPTSGLYTFTLVRMA
jgi:alpha-amylase/alpha-mannosidase (GH57 family)